MSPFFNTKKPKYKSPKKLTSEWSNFRGGLNTLLRPTELDNDEMPIADNIMLEGSGVPTGRWGTTKYFLANATGTVRGLGQYNDPSEDTYEIFALTDQGILGKKNGTTSTTITGQSWPSGSKIRSEQLGGQTYIVSEDVPLTEYDGTDLTVFATVSPPTSLTATNYSGVTGGNRISYKVTAINQNGGETTASNNYVLEDIPFDLDESRYKLFWTAPSAASLSGYVIYRGTEGDETLLANVSPDVTEFTDIGNPTSQTVLAPTTNTTGGVKSHLIKKYKDRLLVVPEDDRNRLMISGRYPYQTKFSWIDGGGFVYIDPDSGEDITGIEVQPIADRIVVYKGHASYLVDLSLVELGNYVVLDPTYEAISTSIGCSNQDTIATVENDTFYFGRAGIYVTGYEPNFLNIIRTNEISARIRPYFDQLSNTDYDTACALYVDQKYILSFPKRREMIVYDRERGAFAGIWKMPYGISHMKKYYDSDGNENWVLGSDDSNQVYEFSPSINTDDGEAVLKTMRTNKEFFGDWSRLYIIRFFYSLFRNVVGSATVNILVEDKDGTSYNAKTYEITGSEVSGSTGWGMDQFGTTPWGDSESTSFVGGGNEIKRWGTLFKQANSIQLEITTSDVNANFEFLGANVDATPQSKGALSSSQRV